MNKDKETQIRVLAENLMRQDNRFEVEGVSDEEYNRYYKLAEQIKEKENKRIKWMREWITS
tara:strand:+ start:322 stop:504 length:183 start_codon:yes stop_codon:yes gene_type:complete